MRRRDFLALAGATGATTAAWPLVARAQQALPLVAVYNINSLDVQSAQYLALFAGLAETGLTEGRDYAVDRFFAAGQADRLPELLAAALQRGPAVIVAGGGILPVQTARDATSTIPIVFTSGVDPVSTGVVRTMNRPGGNITGVYILGRELDGKRLEILHDLVPSAKVIGVIWNPRGTPPDFADIRMVGARLGVDLQFVEATMDEELDRAFGALTQRRAQAVVACSDPVLGAVGTPGLIPHANGLNLPLMHENRAATLSGAFASYGPNVPDIYRLAGTLAGRILKGEQAADLPVLTPTKFELVINNKTARAIGITVPPNVIFRADEIVE